ncbi:MAG: hypothetical protein E7439_03940 [Ruminococcaceae bacterium]|nr:hypothetical protein [Oscillospiraceae bacterium]
MKLYKRNSAMIGTVCGLLLLTMAMIPGPTQARYDNAVTWMGLYDPGTQTVSSDYLTPEGQTVLLQPWKAAVGTSRAKEILISTSKGTADGVLHCSTDSPYITAELDGENIRITQGGYAARLKMTVTDAARQMTQQELAAVTVTLQTGNEIAMKAEFQVMLLPENYQQPDVQESTLQANLTVSPTPAEMAFAWQEKLVFALTAAENADRVELMYNGGTFPAGTRYTIDQGKSFVLGDTMNISIPISDPELVQLQLDFSQAAATPAETVNIAATAYLEGQVTGQMDFVVSVGRAPLALDLANIYPVISGSGSLQIPMTGDQEGLQWKLEQLTKTNVGTAYAPSEALSVEVAGNGENQQLVISNPTGKAPAGTYRLTITRMCGDVTVRTYQVEIFVHY